MADTKLFEEGGSYTDPGRYESSRYRGLYGRYRGWRENQLLNRFLDASEPGDTLLDCPAGVGRLFSEFRRHGLKVIAADLSCEMLRFAKSESDPEVLGFFAARGRQLALEEDAVDWVFSFALMKHLSPDTQFATLSEFNRVARKGIVVSFAILQPFSFPRWWLRHRRRTEDSFPIPELWLHLAAERLGLGVERLGRVLPILGLETVYLLRPAAPARV